ncbi:uncharacterized protein M421DRAFT_427188, partial [Didymella exigua CBS 183.55]
HATHPLRSSSISSSTCCHSVLASRCASCQLRVPSPHWLHPAVSMLLHSTRLPSK